MVRCLFSFVSCQNAKREAEGQAGIHCPAAGRWYVSRLEYCDFFLCFWSASLRIASPDRQITRPYVHIIRLSLERRLLYVSAPFRNFECFICSLLSYLELSKTIVFAYILVLGSGRQVRLQQSVVTAQHYGCKLVILRCISNFFSLKFCTNSSKLN